MQLLYGNDGMNYHTIAKSVEISEQQEKEMLESYLGFSFVPDSAMYSDISREPHSLIYAVTDLSRTLPEERILIARTARMSNYTTPSYYSHFQLLPLENARFADDFLNLLTRDFIKDTDVKSYQDKNIDDFKPEDIGGDEPALNTNALSKDVLFPIIASLLNVTDSLSKRVQLILDVEGDGYNKRSLDVIASIYTCLPYGMRRVIGFNTYAGTGSEKFSNRVRLLLFSRDVLNHIEGEYIDLKSFDAQSILYKIPQNIVNMAHEFVYQEETRKNWFHDFYVSLGTEKITLKDHVDFYENIDCWRNGELDTICDSLASYACHEFQRNTDNSTPLFRLFSSLINDRFVNEDFMEQYQNKLKGLLAQQRDYEFDNIMKEYMVLGEVLPSVRFDETMFLAWQNDAIIKRLCNKYEDLKLYQQMIAVYRNIQNIKLGGDKCQNVFLAMGNEVKNILEQLKKDIEKKIESEKQCIINFFSENEMSPHNYKKIQQQYENIEYRKQNEKEFKKIYAAAIAKYLSKLGYFSSLKMYTEYKKFVTDSRDLLTDLDIQTVFAQIEQRGETVKAMETYSKQVWKNRSDVLKTYYNIAGMRQASEGKKVAVPDYKIMIAGDEFCFSEEELNQVINFICAVNNRNAGEFEHLAYKKERLIEALLTINVFDSGHFETLFNLAEGNTSMRRHLLDYYLTQQVLLSEDTVQKSLSGIEKSQLTNMAELTSDRNILTKEIKEQLKQYNTSNSYQHNNAKKKRKAKPRSIIILSTIIFAMVVLIAAAVVAVIIGLNNGKNDYIGDEQENVISEENSINDGVSGDSIDNSLVNEGE
jgi:hypothetical protein